MQGLRLALALAAVSGVFLLPAQQDETLITAMKSSDRAFDALMKLENKAAPEAVGRAERLGSIYENMIGYWRQKNLPDAVKWSVEGKAAAVVLASAAHAGDAAKAEAALKTLGGTCNSCHDAYRERTPDGKYRIKWPKPK